MKRKIEPVIESIAAGDKRRPQLEGEKKKKEAGKEPEIKKITAERLELQVPDPGETSIAFICNAQDDRRSDSPDFGALMPEAAQEAQAYGEAIVTQIIESSKNKETTDFLFIAADTELIMPDALMTGSGKMSGHKRAVETAERMMAGASIALKKFDLPPGRVLNNLDAEDNGPIEMSLLKDLNIIEESPEVTEYILRECLRETGGDKDKAFKLFWQKYESDEFSQVRLSRGAEGPRDIANRTRRALAVITKAAIKYHRKNPGHSLVTIVIAHYDNMSPFIKDVVGMDIEEGYLPIKKLGGIEIDIDEAGTAQARIQGKEFSLDLNEEK